MCSKYFRENSSNPSSYFYSLFSIFHTFNIKITF